MTHYLSIQHLPTLRDVDRNQNHALLARDNLLSNQTEEMHVNFPQLPEEQIEEHIDNSDHHQGSSSEEDEN